MGEVASVVIKIVFRAGIILAGATAFVLLINFIYTGITVTLNDTVVSDMYGLINIWLPFNLSQTFAWLTTAVSLYITYRLSVISINYMSRFTA